MSLRGGRVSGVHKHSRKFHPNKIRRSTKRAEAAQEQRLNRERPERQPGPLKILRPGDSDYPINPINRSSGCS